MKFSVLGSGSLGNATIVECEGVRILIDAGLSARQLCARLEELGIAPESLHGILLTHEHGDHTRGLKTFLRKYPVPIYASKETAMVLREQKLPDQTVWRTFEAGQSFPVAHMRVQSFAVLHDAVDPVGFVVESRDTKFAVVTDTGQVTRAVIENLRGVNALFLEANYDVEMLDADEKRPWSIKQRISSRHGHLSNDQVEDLLDEIAHSDLMEIVFGHLSADCNCPRLVVRRFMECLGRLGYGEVGLQCASQGVPTKWVEVAARFRLV